MTTGRISVSFLCLWWILCEIGLAVEKISLPKQDTMRKWTAGRIQMGHGWPLTTIGGHSSPSQSTPTDGSAISSAVRTDRNAINARVGKRMSELHVKRSLFFRSYWKHWIIDLAPQCRIMSFSRLFIKRLSTIITSLMRCVKIPCQGMLGTLRIMTTEWKKSSSLQLQIITSEAARRLKKYYTFI